MPLANGTQVGGYEVTGLLGAGGMGEVYRARDVRLQRDVALKVLPASLLQDPDRLARFEREARVLASLNHPNIAAIYGIEDVSGPDGRMPVLALELVEGQTLADRIAIGPVPQDDAIPIALQVAEALEAAHDRGIIHRDLKPANVQITRGGVIKVLDFGLAKALDADPTASGADPAQSPTFTSAPTQAGVIMGTAAYMAPEQARGKIVDRRADIWAFGALLFELLSGDRAFPGETVSDSLAAVLTRTPEWHRLPRDTPGSIRSLIERCLERDPRQRLQSIGEARIVLSNPGRQTTSRDVVRTAGIFPLVVGTIAVAAVALATVAIFLWMMRNDGAAASTVRKLDFAIDGLQTRLEQAPALSPDGARILYVASGRLWIRALSEFTSNEIAQSNGATYPFWSPDGRQVAFVRDAKLWRAPIDGGAPTLVGAVPEDLVGSGGGVWTAAGNFVIVGSDRVGILEISGRDGSSREILTLDRKVESDVHEIAELPDGRGLIFTLHAGPTTDTIAVLADGIRRDVLKLAGQSLRRAVYDPAGYLLYGRESAPRGVYAVRFSLASLQTQGTPFLVDASGNSPTVARDGTLAMVLRSELPSELVWMNRSGGSTVVGPLPGQIIEAGTYRRMRLSPDRQKVALPVANGPAEELWAYDLKRGTASPLSRGAQMASWPTWLPDGSRVLFAGFVGGRAWTVHSVSATETSAPQPVLAASVDPQWPCSVSPDGKWLLYAQTSNTGIDLAVAPFDRPSEAKPLMVTPAREQEGYFSPNGRWIAYLSDESGRFELYIRRFPIGNDRVLVSNGGALAPLWSANGQEIFYRAGAALMSTRLMEKGGALEPSAPQQLFSITDPALSLSFEAAPDGQRFLFARALGSDRFSVILNWTKDLADR
jgi:eukaryotic-like serine/threonine-protein kinase